MSIKRITFLILLATIANSLFGQSDSIKSKRDYINKGSLKFNIGLGYSFIDYELPEGASFISKTYVYAASVDYGITENASIGIGAAYQELNDIPSDGFDSPIIGEHEHLTRKNFAIRYLHHFKVHRNIDLFVGARAGASIWTDVVSPISQFVKDAVSPNLIKPSIQAFVGMHWYFYKILGIQAEVGIGTPYLAEAGLVIRLGNKY